jgi:tetratricopeptide (TPR) repeat protein
VPEDGHAPVVRRNSLTTPECGRPRLQYCPMGRGLWPKRTPPACRALLCPRTGTLRVTGFAPCFLHQFLRPILDFRGTRAVADPFFSFKSTCGFVSLPGVTSKKHQKPIRAQPPKAGAAASAAPIAIPRFPATTPIQERRRWLFRLMALALVPLLLLGGAELALRLTGFGSPARFFLKAEWSGRTVYTDNQRFGRRFFPPSLVRHPQPSAIDAVKSTNTCRIFIFGESAAQGDPDPAFGFGRVLDVLLRARYPGVRFEVANTAITAINSHVILPIARDCARHEGDLWVVYMGNNEVVGPYGAGTVFGAQVPGLGIIRASIALKATRLGQAVSALFRRLSKSGTTPQSWGGMEMFLDQQLRRSDPRMPRVYDYFRQNLRDIIRLGVNSGAKVVVSTVASNLKDCAPFASLHRLGLSAEDSANWEREYAAGMQLEEATNYAGALEHFQQAAKLDGDYADLAYRRGRCSWLLGRFTEAKGSFQTARDEDALRFRADSRINTIIREVVGAAKDGSVVLADGEGALASHSPQGLTGDELLYEHVHLTFEGNYWLARAIAERAGEFLPIRLAARGAVRGDWLSAEECARRLILTEWDRFQGMETMLKRMSQPPFTRQLDWAQRLRRWQDRLAQLRPQTKPYALKQAVSFYREELGRLPEDWLLHSDFGRLLEAAGDEEDALLQYQESLKLMPHNAHANYSIGNLLDHAGKSAAAEPYYLAALRIRPEFYEALNGMGLCLVSQNRFSEALNYYRRAIALNPELPECRVNLGLLLRNLGQTNEAIVQYQQALRLRPDSPSAHINLGNVLSSQGRLPEALEHYAEAVRLSPETPIAHYDLANTLLALGRPEEAVTHYRAAVDLRPDFTEARLNLALELARQGRNDEALAQFLEAVRQDPNSAEAQYDLAVAFAKTRRYDEAISHFRDVLRLQPGHAKAKESLETALALQQKNR